MSRRVRFLIAILIGVVGGLIYGWVVNPVKYVNTTPDTLSLDYKTDYVLMVSEIYHAEGDLNAAARRLAALGSTPPAEMVQQAILAAQKLGYVPSDIQLMNELSIQLQTWTPAPKGGGS